MGDIFAYTSAPGVGVGVTEVNRIPRLRRLAAALGRFFDHQHSILCMITVQAPVVPGGQGVSGVEFPCDPVPAVEADGVQPGLAAQAASFGQQRFGNASRVIDPRVLPPV